MKYTPNDGASSSADFIAPSLREWKTERDGLGVTFYDDFREPRLNTVKIKRPTLKLEFQGKFVAAAIRYDHDQKPVCGKRGAVTEFSRASRTRLFDLFHRLDISKKPIFITLTYMEKWYSAKDSKNHLRAFLERIRRKFPTSSGVWRMEFQERGAPHFHLILFNLPFWKKESVQSVWAEIIGEKGRQPFTRIEQIRSHKGIMSYVSKYVAKLPDGGNSGFNSLTYLHAYRAVFGEEIGRVWGIFNRPAMPFAPKITMERDLDSDYYNHFRPLAIAIFPKIAQYLSMGFRLYVKDAGRFADIARYLFDRPPGTPPGIRLTKPKIPITL